MGSFKPITASYFPLLIKPPRNLAKLQCKLQWLTPPPGVESCSRPPRKSGRRLDWYRQKKPLNCTVTHLLPKCVHVYSVCTGLHCFYFTTANQKAPSKTVVQYAGLRDVGHTAQSSWCRVERYGLRVTCPRSRSQAVGANTLFKQIGRDWYRSQIGRDRGAKENMCTVLRYTDFMFDRWR
jgi:hypothetical protein